MKSVVLSSIVAVALSLGAFASVANADVYADDYYGGEYTYADSYYGGGYTYADDYAYTYADDYGYTYADDYWYTYADDYGYTYADDYGYTYADDYYDLYDYSESLYTYYPSYSYLSYSYPSTSYSYPTYSSSYNYPSYSASKPFTVSAPSSNTTNVTNINQNTNTCTNGSCNTQVTKVVDNSINNSFNTTGSYNTSGSFNGNVVADTIEVTALAVAEPQRIVQRMYTSPEPYVALSQIPYTGFDLGPVGNALYWLSLIVVAVAGAYLMLYFRGGIMSLMTPKVAFAPEAPAEEPVVSKTSVFESLPVREMNATKDSMSVVRSEGGIPRIVINRG